MFEDFNTNALEFGEIDETFMEEWHIELDEDELETWDDAFENNDQEFIDMLNGDFSDSVVDKFFDIACERDIFPSQNAHDDDGNITDEYRSLVVSMYDTYFKSN